MRNNKRFTLLFVISLILSLGMASATLAAGNDKKKKKKQPKNTGILSVTTSPTALPVKVDGQLLGMSGVGDPAEFYLTPGVHRVEIEGPNGQSFSRDINIIKKVKSCICLNVVENTTKRPCPYDMRVDGPESVTEGDLVTFVARNVASVTPIAGTALNYAWKVSPSSARVTSGLGTPAITVDTTGLGGRTLMVELEVTDGVYDASCRQRIAVDTEVVKLPDPEPKVAILFDEFPFRSFDDDKARMDNLAIELQNNPSWSGYIIMYQGTDKRSQGAGDVARLSRRALDYLVKTRGVDPSRVQIVRGGTRPTTTYQFWLVPPGADLPVPN
ncbi:MAG: hypothetical protein HKN33_05940 [Pyrinomonadaceae bacterium]|nr:hypothetical protein [Pyrinomonadaceae bacterium]